MTKTLLAALFLLLPAAGHAQTGCRLTVGGLTLEKPRPALTPLSEATNCQNRNWDILAASAAVQGSSPTFVQIWVDTITARGARIYVSSYTLFGSSVYVMGAGTALSSWTFNASGAAVFSLGTSSGISIGAGGIRYADGSYQYTATPPGAALVNGTNTWTGGNKFVGAPVELASNTLTLNGTGAKLNIWGSGGLNIGNSGTDAGYFTVSPTGVVLAYGEISSGVGGTDVVGVTGQFADSGNFWSMRRQVTGNGWALDIYTAGGAYKNALKVNDNESFQVGGSSFTLLSSGNVGFGTASPASKLQVEGSAAIVGGPFTLSNSSLTVLGDGTSANNGAIKLGQSSLAHGLIKFNYSTGRYEFTNNEVNASSGIDLYANSGVRTFSQNGDGATQIGKGSGISTFSATGQLTVPSSLGIGTASPLAKLSVVGDQWVSGAATFGSSVTLPNNTKLGFSGGVADNAEIWYSDSDGQFYFNNTYTGVPASAIYGHVFRGGVSTNLMKLTGSGLIIGNAFADGRVVGARLDVDGNAQFGSGVNKSTFSATGALSFSAGQPINYAVITGTLTVLGGSLNPYAVIVASANGKKQLSVDTYGFVASTSQPAARYTRTTALTTLNDTNTAVKFVNREYDSMNANGATPLFAVTTATIPVGGDGTYMLRAFASFEASATGRRNISILKNGAVIPGCSDVKAGITGDETRVNVACAPYLVAGDAITVSAYQNEGSVDLDINSATFEIKKELY